MYVNKCIKCGAEFETKNPKRVICPNCLYADKGNESTDEKPMQNYSSYSAEPREQRSYQRPQNDGYRNNYRDNGGYQRRDDNGYQRRDNNYGGGYNRDNRGGGYQRRDNGGGYNRDNRGGGYNRDNNRRQGGFRNNYASQGGRPQQRRPQPNKKPRKQPRPLLVSKEQLEQIEALYKTMLPLPNPDAHEVIAAHIGIEPQKVFFGINLVRQKMMLPKLPFPKRKLAISPDQMMAIKALYEPLLPLPPIGCHKIIAAQLKMDEWRVHVGIKLIRAQMGLDRWNEERTDKPADYMVAKHPQKAERKAMEEEAKKAQQEAAVAVEEPEAAETEEAPAEEKPKRGRPKKKADEE
jgi:hypothetical protein